jgi:ADP-ribose pyrophosphatase
MRKAGTSSSSWRRLETNKIYEFKDRNTTYLELYQDKVQTPTGKIMSYIWYTSSDVAVIVPFLNNDTLIMINQYRYPLRKALLEFPAGHIEKREKPKDTADRELEEETGYKATSMECIYKYHPSVSKSKNVVYVFKATGLTKGRSRLDETEDISIKEVTVQQLHKKIQRQEIENAGTLIPFFLCCTDIKMSRK